MATVYEIRNLVNWKLYIGSTTRKPKDRKREHWAALRGGRHHNRHLQAAWNLYGEEAFRFTPIYTCDCSEAEIRDVETQHIRNARAKLGRKNVYTIRDGDENPMKNPQTVQRSVETRMADPAWRDTRLAVVHGLVDNPVWQAAQREAGALRSQDPEWRTAQAEGSRRRSQSPEWKAAVKEAAAHRAKTYFFLDPAGAVVEVHNLSAFCQEHGLSPGNMINVYQGKRPHHKGYRRYDPSEAN